MNEDYLMKTVVCECGKMEHYADADYCGACGRKLEEATSDDSL